MTRKAIFDAVRAAAKPGLFDDPGNVLALDNLLDAFGVGRDGAPSGTTRKTSPAGIDLIHSFEGLRLTAYPDPGTGGKPWTIGWGATTDEVGAPIQPGTVWTKERADARFVRHLAQFEDAVAKLCPVTTQGQFDALVSFCYNVGEGSLKESTLRRLHNEGDYANAAAQFVRWNKAGGQIMKGLTRRREAEAKLYRGQA